MDDYIAYCGLNCKECEARIATINNDELLKEEVAKKWSKLNGVVITKEMINCVGCKLTGVKTPFCESLCEIRKCAIAKKQEKCLTCGTHNACAKIKMIIDNNQESFNK